jgi:hypothetical protein
MDLQGELGYELVDADRSTCATGCHSASKAFEWAYGDLKEFTEHHEKHREKQAGCQDCHGFSR